MNYTSEAVQKSFLVDSPKPISRIECRNREISFAKMDESSNQSSRSSQQLDLDESKHRETESPMTLEYNSDSELHEGDTLRMEDSDDDDREPLSVATPSEEPEKSGEPTKEVTTAPRNRISQLVDSDSEDENPPRSASPTTTTTSKKISRIIDSDSDETNDGDKTLVRRNRIDSGSDSDGKSLVKQNQTIDAIGDEIDKNMSRLKSLVDSDSTSAAQEEEPEGDVRKRKKQLKTKKERSKAKEKQKDPKDLLASLNLDFSDDSRSNAGSDSDSKSSGSGSDSETEGHTQRKPTNKRGTEDKPQRMSAKAAMDQMKVIQSESQRMAREAAVSVPYHKPKQRSLEEFLNRPTVKNPMIFPADKHMSLAAAIRMPPEQLEAFAKHMEEREKETIEFFKNENVTEDPAEDVPEQAVEPSIEAPSESAASEALVNKTCENAERLLASQATESSPKPSTSYVIDYDLFSEPTPPPSSKLAQKKAELLSSNASIPAFPTLKGGPDMEIDLDSGELKPRTPSGPDVLFQRFAKCSGKKAQPTNSPSLSILSTDKGVIELDTIALASEQVTRDPNGKDPIPGAAFAKLQQGLREKMAKIRMDALKKRLEEQGGGKKLEESDEEQEECDALELDDEEEEEEADELETETGPGNQLLNDEASEEETENPEGDPNGSGSDNSSSEDEQPIEPEVAGEKKKSRIIAAFEDSDDESKQNTDVADLDEGTALLKKAGTEELFSTLEESEKFTLSDRNNLETGDTMSLLWKESEDPVAEVGSTQADNDLLALCSGRFGETQAPTTMLETDCSEAALFSQTGPTQLGDSQLMALCSGTFATQRPEAEVELQTTDEIVTGGKLVIGSSDEEDTAGGDTESRKKVKRKKRRNINISDDESASEAEPEPLEDAEPENSELDEEEPERYVDYDSEENEVEVVLTKKDKQKVANAFVENEAELSEEEWAGSDDEDEKDLDRYDIELGDEEQFDQNQLQQDLGRIHMRRVLEQDKKEVKTLQDMFFEDEENDGVGRERQFRWRNVETTFSLDYDKKTQEEGAEGAADGDDETEAQWRKMRHEREMLLKEKKIDLDEVNLTSTLLDKTLEEEENNSAVTNMTVMHSKKKITIVRAKKTTEAITPKDSPFLITRSSIVQGNKASFLSRDEGTLNKLASLVKANPETEGASTVGAGKGRNFVFAAVSPAVDKMSSKRSLDPVETGDDQSSAKKAKTIDSSSAVKPKKRLLLGLI